MRNSAYEARQVREIIQQLRRLQVHQEALIEDLSNLQEASNPNKGIGSDHTPIRELRTPRTATATSTLDTRRARRIATAIANGGTRQHSAYSPETDRDNRDNDRDTGRRNNNNNTSPSFQPQNNTDGRYYRPNYALSDIRRFVIGDRVRVINPGRLQENEGQIISISVSRVTLRTATGNTIVRAALNLRFCNE